MIARRIGLLTASAAAVAAPLLSGPVAHATPIQPATINKVAPASAPCSSSPGPWRLHTSALRIHSRPTTSSPVLGILYQGQHWRVLSWTRDESWVRITDTSTRVTGWVSGTYFYRLWPLCLD
jgi:uncharacterized protein YgiM (DUF1202 family)